MLEHDSSTPLAGAVGIVGLIAFAIGQSYGNKLWGGLGSLVVGLVILFKVFNILQTGSIFVGSGDDSASTSRRYFRSENPTEYWLGTAALAILGMAFSVFGYVQLLM